MNKLFASSVIVAALFSTGIASAQTYSYGSGSSSACTNLTMDLTVGSRGAQVTSLQSFLVAQNYPGSGAWMVTGYFGQATAAAVRIYQQNHGLPSTGVVDSATRASINAASCGYLATPNYISNPFSYSTYNYTNTYPYQNQYSNTFPYTYPYTGSVSITSMSQNTGVPGNSVTLFGVGFDAINNTVYFGTQAVSGIPSGNGTSLTFTIPTYYGYAANQSVQLYVTNSHGTSNSMSFTLYPYGSTYFPYNYNFNYQNQYQCGGTYPYSYGQCGCGLFGVSCPNPTGVPTVNYLNPNSGAVGTSVTVFGNGFSATGNSVHFGNGVITGLNSPDGRAVSFIVPSQLTGFGSQPVIVGTYNVSVTNSSGITSNTLPFTVTSVASGVAPSITSVNGPTTLGLGVQGTWTIQVNNPGGSYLTVSVNWGDSNVYGYAASAPQTVYVQGQSTLTFTHTYYTGGTYAPLFTASNSSGQQNSTSASVVVSGSGGYNTITLSYLSPTSGHVGTQVILTGTGFSTYDNTVHFGIGGTQHVPSINGTTIYYTIPAFVSPCDLIGFGCAAPASQVVPGAYPIYITNVNGTSNTMSFQVQ